jgi:hypothetical protein
MGAAVEMNGLLWNQIGMRHEIDADKVTFYRSDSFEGAALREFEKNLVEIVERIAAHREIVLEAKIKAKIAENEVKILKVLEIFRDLQTEEEQ